MLANGWPVAVKHIIKNEHAETFLREVTSLSHVRHPNLVSLRGYCDGQDECFLVYEFCINGNLSEWLFGKDKNLSWIQRLQIALGSACGLWFLHIYPEGCIVHRDIKVGCYLKDQVHLHIQMMPIHICCYSQPIYFLGLIWSPNSRILDCRDAWT